MALQAFQIWKMPQKSHCWIFARSIFNKKNIFRGVRLLQFFVEGNEIIAFFVATLRTIRVLINDWLVDSYDSVPNCYLHFLYHNVRHLTYVTITHQILNTFMHISLIPIKCCVSDELPFITSQFPFDLDNNECFNIMTTTLFPSPPKQWHVIPIEMECETFVVLN